MQKRFPINSFRAHLLIPKFVCSNVYDQYILMICIWMDDLAKGIWRDFDCLHYGFREIDHLTPTLYTYILLYGVVKAPSCTDFQTDYPLSLI